MAKHKKKQVFINRKFHSNLKDVYAVATIAVSLLLLTFAYSGGGVAGRFVNGIMELTFGMGRYLLPVCLIIWAIHFMISKETDYDTFGYGLIVCYFSILTLVHLQIPLADMMKKDVLPRFGGVAGALFAYSFKYLIGAPGGYIASLFFLIIGLMLVTEIKVSSLGNAFVASLKKARAHISKDQPAADQELSVKRQVVKAKIVDTDLQGEEPEKGGLFKEDGLPPSNESKPTVELPKPAKGDYSLPPLSLYKIAGKSKGTSKADIKENISLLEKTLHNFDVDAGVSRVVTGPTVTRYEIQLASGVKVNRILSLADDIALTFASPDVRIIAPIPGKSAIGIEVPNIHRELVTIGDILNHENSKTDNHPLTIVFGKDISGNPVLANLGDMPHLLIAGATGSGKSVCINSIIASILSKARPDQVKLIMVDPKRVELTLFNGIPHLLTPVVTNSKQASNALAWAVAEMDNRFDILSESKTKNIDGFNRKMEKEGAEKMPFIVLIIDELADLMMVAPREVEDAICRLSQLARAVGIHLIIATQRPSTDVITGLIKANITTRVAFAVSSMTDSRVILDTGGAEKLVGKGDALYSTPETIKPRRIQGAFVTETEIQSLCDFTRNQAQPEYVEDITKPLKGSSGGQDFDDELFDDAMQQVVTSGKASVSYLQRRLRIGYGRAARLMDMLEDRGIVSPQDGSRPREVLVAPGEVEPSPQEQEIELVD